MLEQLKYVNHINETFEFGKNGIFVNMSDLHNYEWTATTRGNRIGSLTRSVATRTLPVIIMCDSEAEGIAARNRLLEVVEKDVLSMQHGKVIINNYYFKCFVTKCTKEDYLTSKRYLAATLTLTSDFPYWVKESVTGFRQGGTGSTEGSSESAWLDFPYDFSYDFFSTMASTVLVNSNFVATNFKMIIYGACSNPSISIAGHTYKVNCDLGDSDYLTIDSTTKKIQITRYNGDIVNAFNDRDKSSYIFEKIPSGTSMVTWVGSYGFDVVLMEERGEPKWT